MTSPVLPFLGQIALTFGGTTQYTEPDDEIEGCHHHSIEFPNMWKAMAFRDSVMVPQVLGLPAQASRVELEEDATVTSVAQPVTLRVTSNPKYAEAIEAAYFVK